MALLPDQKFSTFQTGGNPTTGDIIVGLRGGINTQFTWPTPSGISSITGTADEVLVNGTSGSPIIGAVTLTTPQPIAPTSSPTFANLTVTTQLDVANLRLVGNTISSTDTNGNINLIPNGTGIILGLGSTSFASRQGMEIQKSGNEVNYTAGSFANAVGSAPKFNAYKSRSTTVGVHVAVQTSDELGFYTAWGDDGTTFSQAAQIRILAGSTVSTGIVSGTLQLNTSSTSGVMTNALTINDSQIVSLTNPLPVSSGGSGNTTFTAYSVICAGTTATGAFQNVSGLGSANQVLVSNGPGALPSWQSVPGLTPAALTKTDDTNVTLTLGGSPSTALLQATSLTLGWTGTLSPTRGGTGVNNSALTINLSGGSTGYLLTSDSSGNATWQTPAYLTGAVLLNPSADQSIIANNLYMTSGGFISGGTIGPQGALGVGNVQVITSGGATPNFIAASYNNASGGAPTFWGYKSRGTGVGNFAALQSGDVIARLLGFGDDGAAFRQSCSIVYEATGTISSGIVPGRIVVSTANSSGVVTQALTIDSSQVVNVASLTSNATITASGNIQATSGLLISGTTAGGFSGNVVLYSTTSSKGNLQVVCANNTNNPNIIIQNANFTTTGSITLTIPDPGGSAAKFALTPGSITSGNFVSYSGTSGLLQDSGIATNTFSNATSWTPVASFATVGDLSVAYTVQSGNYVRSGKMIIATFQVSFTPTYTTAAGNFTITGLPVTPANNAFGEVSISGVTLTALYTQVTANAQNDGKIYMYQSGSAQARALLTVTQLVSGVAYSFYGSVTYMV